VDALVEVGPDVDRASATAAVHGVFGLINSVSDYDPKLSDADMTELLTAMAEAALRVPRRA
jgi:hypothetical protein